MSKKHTERGFDRMVNFSDAVVAIAITLLVLPLIDLLDGESSSVDFAKLLQENISSFTSFVIAFAVLAGYWRLHHQLFELLDDYNSVLIRLNTLWLMVVVLLPFLSASLSLSEQSSALVALLLAITALSLLLGAMSAYCSRKPELQAADTEANDFNTQRFWWFAAFEFGVAGLAFWIGPEVAWALVLLLPLGWLTDWNHRRLVSREEESATGTRG